MSVSFSIELPDFFSYISCKPIALPARSEVGSVKIQVSRKQMNITSLSVIGLKLILHTINLERTHKTLIGPSHTDQTSGHYGQLFSAHHQNFCTHD